MFFVYITCANKKEAEQIARVLLRERLVLCANIWPVESIYLWKKKIEKCRETVLLVKTFKKNYKKVERLVKKLHSYEVPIIAGIEVKDINREYIEEMKKELKK